MKPLGSLFIDHSHRYGLHPEDLAASQLMQLLQRFRMSRYQLRSVTFTSQHFLENKPEALSLFCSWHQKQKAMAPKEGLSWGRKELIYDTNQIIYKIFPWRGCNSSLSDRVQFPSEVRLSLLPRFSLMLSNTLITSVLMSICRSYSWRLMTILRYQQLILVICIWTHTHKRRGQFFPLAASWIMNPKTANNHNINNISFKYLQCQKSKMWCNSQNRLEKVLHNPQSHLFNKQIAGNRFKEKERKT